MLFKPVTIRGKDKENNPFLRFFFDSKGLDAINLGNILHHKYINANL
jgi:hypothetical protein